VLGAFRDHPQVTIALDQKRIGQVPRLFEHGNGLSSRAHIIELDRRNDAFSDSVIKIFKRRRVFFPAI